MFKNAVSRIPAASFVLLMTLVLSAVWLSAPASAQDTSYNRKQVPSIDAAQVVPLVTLRNWKESKPNERYAFLIGFVTMVEAEKEWQGRKGKKLQPFKNSLVGSWVKGFENRPLKELYDGINDYIEAHPSELHKPLAEVMWFSFVQPRLPEKKSGKRG